MDELCISDQRCLFVGGDGVKRSIIILCVVCLVLAGCVGGGEIVTDQGHSDHSDHDHGEEDTKKEVPKEQVSSIIAPGLPTFEILSKHPVECVNESNIVDIFIDVFGVYVIAPEDAPIEKVQHTANVLAQYIDNDEDGVPDDPNVLRELVENNYIVPVWREEDEEAFRDYVNTHCEDVVGVGASMFFGDHDRYWEQGGGDSWVFGGIANANAIKNGGPGEWDANLEEVWHIVTWGWFRAYPEQLGNGEYHPWLDVQGDPEILESGQGELSVKLTVAMDTARGGYFIDIPKQYPDDAWYKYYDPTCWYGCQTMEYFYWILMANMGASDPELTHACVESKDESEIINEEWGICTRDELEQKDVLAFELLNDSGFNFPTVIPDGSYRADHDQGEEEVWACCKAMTASCIACSEGLTKQEWLDKTCGPGCTDAVYAGWDEETKKMKWDCIY